MKFKSKNIKYIGFAVCFTMYLIFEAEDGVIPYLFIGLSGYFIYRIVIKKR